MESENVVAVHRVPCNKGKLTGPKPPLKLREIWAIRMRLQMASNVREFAMFNRAIDSKLRACDLTRLRGGGCPCGAGCCGRYWEEARDPIPGMPLPRLQPRASAMPPGGRKAGAASEIFSRVPVSRRSLPTAKARLPLQASRGRAALLWLMQACYDPSVSKRFTDAMQKKFVMREHEMNCEPRVTHAGKYAAQVGVTKIGFGREAAFRKHR